ncbi:MAG: DUF5777 family beta-barrel protein [Fodinibius sp.]|nr:DUF5777 family beta-barrel protein [Fodinibius sp.]
MKFPKITTLLFIYLLVAIVNVQAQMERERASVAEPVETFWTPTLISQATTETLQARNLNVTIMHSFGIATSNVVRNFFGLDNVQNVRLGLDYGLTDRWTVGIGRSSLFNVVDLRSKFAAVRQMSDGASPFSLSFKGDLSIVTQENRQPVRDDISSLLSATLSRKFSETISIQLAPMYGYYSSIDAGQQRHLFALGMGSRIEFARALCSHSRVLSVSGSRRQRNQQRIFAWISTSRPAAMFSAVFRLNALASQQYAIAQNTEQFSGRRFPLRL